MPYTKPFKPRKKRYMRSKRTSSLAQKAFRLAKKATQTMEMHKLSIDGFVTRAGRDHPGNYISAIAEGNLSSNREGLRIWARSLRLHYEAKWAVSAAGVQLGIRVLVVCDKMYNGTPPTLDQLLQEQGASTYKVLSQRNNETEGKRFIFLYDKVHRNPNQVSTDNYSTSRKMIIPLKFPIHYTGNLGTSPDGGKNALWLFAVGDNTVVSAQCPELYVTMRLYFDP